MIRAILKKGKIQHLEKLPSNWRDGQELLVEDGSVPSDDPVEIKKWYKKLQTLSAKIPDSDYERFAAAIAQQDRQAKKMMRREMGLD